MSGPTVLVADRDPAFLAEARANLEAEGYTVVVAPDGREALARAQAATPALLVIEVALPVVDGWKLVKRVRGLPGLAQVPVLFLSERSTETSRRQALKVGVDDVLLKPVHAETLAFRVARALAQREKVEQAQRTLQKAADTRRLLASRAGPAAPGAPPGPSRGADRLDGAALAGDLQHVGLPTLLGMLDVEHKTGRVTLVHGDDGAVGWIELRSGRAVRARTDAGATGRDAVLAMLGWVSGAFRFHVEPVDGADEIGAPTPELLLEGARSADESARMPAVGLGAPASPPPATRALPRRVPVPTGDAPVPPLRPAAPAPPPRFQEPAAAPAADPEPPPPGLGETDDEGPSLTP